MRSRFEKYHGRRAQRFSIRKYSFGAASVLLGTALLLGANAVKADETHTGSANATEVTNSDKQKPDLAITTPVVEELPELKIDAVKTDEKAEVKEDAKPAATPVEEKEVTETTADKTDKKLETDVKEKSDKEQADKKEADKEKTDKETSEKVETEKTQDDVKTVLTQLTSEAEVMASVASNFSAKEVKDEAAKKELAVSIEAVKLEAAKSNDLLSSDASKDQMVAQVNRLSAAIEAVYAEMKRAGHAGKVEAVLGATDGKSQTITGKGVVREGKAVVNVQNAYITMNPENTKPLSWGIQVAFDTSKAQAGDTTTIELKNLAAFGGSFKKGTKITATDGTVIGEVTEAAQSNSTGNKGTTSPYWAQRMKAGMTYEERLKEQPPIANEVGTVTYTIKWNDKAKDYALTTYNVEYLTGNAYQAPQISKDTDYTASIKVDGQTILEHVYTNKATIPSSQKQSTGVSLTPNSGLTYEGAKLVKQNDTLTLNTDTDVRYGKGSKFTVKLPNTEFNYFKEIEGSKNTVSNTNKDDSVTYRPSDRFANAKPNENNVWILQDGRDTNFTLKATVKSPTEVEFEVVDGAIQEGSTVSVDLAKLGVKREITNRTFTDEFSKLKYDDLGRVTKGSSVGNDKTAGTLTVTGGTPLEGEKEDITTKVNNGWVVNASPAGSTAVETGAVTLTLTDLETGKIIGYTPTEYKGDASLKEDGTYETKNILGKKYDVTNQLPDTIKTVNETDYILADIPPKGPAGTINVSDKRVRDIMTPDEITATGLNPNAYVNNVIYSYVKKTKVEEVNRTIKFVYAENVADLAGTEVFPSQKQTVSYTGKVKLTADGKAVVDTNDKPIYIDWNGTNGQSTDLPELAVPQKEGYIASVEKVPVQATTATDEDYEYVVTYTAIQKAKTTFVDEKGNPIPGVAEITEQGGSETPLTKEAEVKAKIKELENKGYELVSNTYPEGGKFDKDKDTDQEFKVTLKAKEVTVTPNQSKTPGTPEDPNNPDGPKYPAGLEEKDLNKTVTRTITYVYEDGTPVLNEDGTPKTVTQEAKFTREAKVNLVTGDVTYGDWSEAKDLPEVKSPGVTGYLADKASVPVVNVTGDSKDITEVVTYKPLGSWVPNIPGQPTTPIKYPNNLDDPTKPGKPTETLPYVPGFTPEDKDGNPLKPVDPNDPTKGYVVPNIPTDPSQDTVINYVANKANLVVKYVDEKGKDLIPAETTEGKVGDEYSTSGKVIPGHLLVRVEGEAKGKIGKDGSTVTYVYKPIGSWIPNIPGQPTNPIKYPNNPADPTKPGQPTEVLPYVPGFTPEDKDGNPLKPVDPNDPTKGYVVPNIPTDPSQDTVINYVANKAKLVVKYVDEKGKDLIPAETTEGKVGDEYSTSGKVIPGHLLVRVEGEAKGKIGKDGSTVTYVYKPIGSWIPNIPGQPTTPIKYPNDPTDPTKPGSDKPVLPYVPGHTPVDGNGQPLKPVDPKDPTKGYEVPSVPTNPGEDTPINYIPNSPKPNPTPYPGPTPAPTPKPEPKPEPAPIPSTPETPEKPVAPVQPEQPTNPTPPAVPTPAETPVATDSATQPATPKYVEGQKELPNTGTEANASLAALGLLGALSGFGLLARKKKED